MARHQLHRLLATAVFAYALILYGTTVAPTTSFWDSGEFIASAYGLQVMHPPGSPVYMLVARLFAMFVPASYVALAVNGVSVLASAGTVLLAYLIIVQLVGWWQARRGEALGAVQPVAMVGGVIGACTFAVTDSFWFSAVEAEVYALSMLCTALAVWLGLVWSARVRAEQAAGSSHVGSPSDRLLVVIAYLFGLAIGVHLMALLTFFFIALIIYFTRVEQPGWSLKKQVLGLVAAGAVASVAFVAMYPGTVVWLPEAAEQSRAPVVFFGVLAVLLVAGLAYTQRRGWAGINLALLCATGVLIGASAYALIPIRSAADPEIDLNDPETAEALIPYLKREQYGARPLLYGATFDDTTGYFDPRRNKALFPRRNSFDLSHGALYAAYASDADYFLRYQLGHMYGRYLLWNFAGRAKDEQGSGVATGFSKVEQAAYVYATPSEAASRNVYFALPLLLGLIGFIYHIRRDGRRALAVLVLFLATGAGLVVYLNEIPQTPRERDYIFVASFFAFSLWIGLGAAGLVGDLLHRLRGAASGVRRGAALVLAGALFLAVPGWMLVQNYDDHDRSGQYVARDFAYNLLMSLDENAILFTNGDNDTYPLWYLQGVENVRPDVRVVCLELLNTPWYARQLRDQQAHEAPPLPISLTDEQLDALTLRPWAPRDVQLPVDKDRLLRQRDLQISVEDTSGFDSPMQWTLEGRPYSADMRVLYPVDHVVLDILAGNAQRGWTRPVYFAVSTAQAARLNLDPYLQLEGMALRVVPIRHNESFARVVPRIMLDRLAHFRFTGLDDPSMYFDPSSRAMAGNYYRLLYARTARELVAQGRPAEARAVVDRVMDAVPPDTIPLPFLDALSIARVYETLGDVERTAQILSYTEPYVLNDVYRSITRRQIEQAVQQAQLIQRAYLLAGDFEGAAHLSDRLADLLSDEAFRMAPDELRKLYEEMRRPDDSAAETG